MLKEISALKARQNLGQVINEAGLREDELLKEVSRFRFKATKSKNIDQAIAEAVLAAKKAELK